VLRVGFWWGEWNVLPHNECSLGFVVLRVLVVSYTVYSLETSPPGLARARMTALTGLCGHYNAN
jgi:hypothetical protein